jgi:hypothetical protein
MTPRTTLLSVVLAVALVGSLQPTHAQKPVEATQPVVNLDAWCPLVIHRCLDADTVVADVYLPWGVCLVDQYLRVDSFDAWEVSKRRDSEAAGEITDAEVARGKKAKAEFEELLKAGTLYAKPGVKARDNYGRLLGPWKLVTGVKEEDVRAIAARKGWIRK